MATRAKRRWTSPPRAARTSTRRATFADCILNGRRPWSTLEDALVTMRLAEAIYASHKGSFAEAP